MQSRDAQVLSTAHKSLKTMILKQVKLHTVPPVVCPFTHEFLITHQVFEHHNNTFLILMVDLLM